MAISMATMSTTRMIAAVSLSRPMIVFFSVSSSWASPGSTAFQTAWKTTSPVMVAVCPGWYVTRAKAHPPKA